MIADDLVCILLYANDIVLLSETAADLQLMLDCLNEWCGANSMSVSASKINAIHFRSNSVPKIDAVHKTWLLRIDKYI